MKNSATPIVRKATISDIDSLVELRKFLLSEGIGHYVSKTPEEEAAWQESYRKWLHMHINTNEKVRVAVANEHNSSNILACAIGIIDERAPMRGCLNGKVGWIQTVVVHPEHRRRGIAELVMQYILNWFEINKVGKVTLQTTPMARRLYEKIGFIDSGEQLLLKEL
ncbi:GNAT family N-acetyltransferase [Bacillus sp. FSL W8-0223]|jgi:GNAT superfamily N-acetyltransferase|uniref:GNAT family N-acetyltransferase n=1 Tax=Bacillus sp. FSL W8-0223 TaxID=2954595 RepID=UPI0030F6A25D